MLCQTELVETVKNVWTDYLRSKFQGNEFSCKNDAYLVRDFNLKTLHT